MTNPTNYIEEQGKIVTNLEEQLSGSLTYDEMVEVFQITRNALASLRASENRELANDFLAILRDERRKEELQEKPNYQFAIESALQRVEEKYLKES